MILKIRILLISALFLFVTLTQVHAGSHVFNTDNGLCVVVECCSDQVFRVRISPQGTTVPENLMDRYGIVRNDWPDLHPSVKEDNGLALVSNGRYILSLDERTGCISISDKENNKLIGDIIYLPPDDGRTLCMGEMLDARYEWCKQLKPIIGTDRKTTLVPTNDVGDTSDNSMLSFDLHEGERFYGGGNSSHDHIQHRGEILRMWTREAFTGMTVPFIMSSEGWAVLVNTSFRHYFDIGASVTDKMLIYNTVPYFDFYLLLGASMLDAVKLYTDVTGKSTLLPNWAYGSSFGGIELQDALDLMADALRFRDERIPMDMLWIEPQWMSKHYDYSSRKDWNYEKFPAAPVWARESRGEFRDLFIGRLHALGYRLALWLCVEIDDSIDEEDDIAAANGAPLSGREHWFDHLTRFIDQGVDGFKLDPGSTQEEHPKRRYYNGRTDDEMHNINQVIMPKRMLLTFRNHTGGRRSFHHYCGAWSGTQRWSAQTCGDIGGGGAALYDQLNLSMSGFLNTSCDAMAGSGLEGLHMATFLPWLQINSWMSFLQPWYYSKSEKAVYADYLKLRHALYPCIYSAAVRGAVTAEPMIKALPLVFPDDRNVDDMSHEFLFCDNLLVGVWCDSLYIPEGKWEDFWTGETYEGNGTFRRIGIPSNRRGHLFVRKGAIIPFQKEMDHIGERPLDTLAVRVWPYGESRYDLYEDDGLTYKFEEGNFSVTGLECRQNGRNITFVIKPASGYYDGMYGSRIWELEFHGVMKPSRVIAGGDRIKDWSYGDGTLHVTVSQPDTSKELTLTIE